MIIWTSATITDLLKQISLQNSSFFDYGGLTSINSWLQTGTVMKLLRLQLYSKLKENCCFILPVISFIFLRDISRGILFSVHSIQIWYTQEFRMTARAIVYPLNNIKWFDQFSLRGGYIFHKSWSWAFAFTKYWIVSRNGK